MSARLDIWLVEQGLAPSRTKAKALILDGSVFVDGTVVTKSSFVVQPGQTVQVQENELLRYVSRGGLKLEKALQEFQLDFTGARVLDIGSSTGGFTDCALQHGATEVFAVDVGTAVMDAELAKDARIHLYEQTDIRQAPACCFDAIDYVVCDASFISLTAIFPVLGRIQNDFQAAMLIKPQFECGAQTAHKYKGVITDAAIHIQVIQQVVHSASETGFFIGGLTYSPICGGSGNREYLLYLSNKPFCQTVTPADISQVVSEAFSQITPQH